MIGVDTNILARLFVEDDPRQSELARQFLGQRTPDDPAYVSAVVLVELAWLLESVYGFGLDEVFSVMGHLCDSANIRLEQESWIVGAIERARSSHADLADSIIAALAQAEGCKTTMTFDRKAAVRVPGMELLQ